MGYWYNKINVDRMLLLKTIAVLQIFVAVTNLVTRAGTIDKVHPTASTGLQDSG